MDRQKQHQIEAAGWTTGSVTEFLGLTPDEAAIIEIRAALARCLHERQGRRARDPQPASRRIETRAGIAPAEREDNVPPIDGLVQALLVSGASPRDIADVIASIGSDSVI